MIMGRKVTDNRDQGVHDQNTAYDLALPIDDLHGHNPSNPQSYSTKHGSTNHVHKTAKFAWFYCVTRAKACVKSLTNTTKPNGYLQWLYRVCNPSKMEYKKQYTKRKTYSLLIADKEYACYNLFLLG